MKKVDLINNLQNLKNKIYYHKKHEMKILLKVGDKNDYKNFRYIQ